MPIEALIIWSMTASNSLAKPRASKCLKHTLILYITHFNKFFFTTWASDREWLRPSLKWAARSLWERMFATLDLFVLIFDVSLVVRRFLRPVHLPVRRPIVDRPRYEMSQQSWCRLYSMDRLPVRQIPVIISKRNWVNFYFYKNSFEGQEVQRLGYRISLFKDNWNHNLKTKIDKFNTG